MVLADLTHRFLEKPLRQARKRPTKDDLPVNSAIASMKHTPGSLRAVGGVLISVCVAGLLLIQPMWMSTIYSENAENLDPKLYPGAAAFAMNAETPKGVEFKPDPILVGGIMPPTAVAFCFIGQDMPADYLPSARLDGTPCTFGDREAKTEVYVVGGSHAEQWIAGLDRLGREMHFKIVPMLRQDCPIELGDDLTVTPECNKWGEMVTDRIVDAKPALVISTPPALRARLVKVRTTSQPDTSNSGTAWLRRRYLSSVCVITPGASTTPVKAASLMNAT